MGKHEDNVHVLPTAFKEGLTPYHGRHRTDSAGPDLYPLGSALRVTAENNNGNVDDRDFLGNDVNTYRGFK